MRCYSQVDNSRQTSSLCQAFGIQRQCTYLLSAFNPDTLSSSLSLRLCGSQAFPPLGLFRAQSPDQFLTLTPAFPDFSPTIGDDEHRDVLCRSTWLERCHLDDAVFSVQGCAVGRGFGSFDSVDDLVLDELADKLRSKEFSCSEGEWLQSRND